MKNFFITVLMFVLCSLSFGAWGNDYTVNKFGDITNKIAVASDETKTFFVSVFKDEYARFEVNIKEVYLNPNIQVKFDDGEIIYLKNIIPDRLLRNVTNMVLVNNPKFVKKIKTSKSMEVAITLNNEDFVIFIDNANSKNAIEQIKQ